MIPGSGRSPGEGNGHPLQSSCLENPMDRGAWRATVHGVAKSWTRLNTKHKGVALQLRREDTGWNPEQEGEPPPTPRPGKSLCQDPQSRRSLVRRRDEKTVGLKHHVPQILYAMGCRGSWIRTLAGGRGGFWQGRHGLCILQSLFWFPGEHRWGEEMQKSAETPITG